MDRESFYDWLWQELGGSEGLCGVDEGTVLSDEASSQGLETESWTVDSGEAPRERDWIGKQSTEDAALYFMTRLAAEQARVFLLDRCALRAEEVEEQEPQDWDAQWKASFKGVDVPPFWEIRPPWENGPQLAGSRRILINPGAGFGTGTHETTQLCMQALGEATLSGGLKLEGRSALDFGSGSGILSIAAALVGAARVDAVEIDPLANDNAFENARLNGVEKRLQIQTELPQVQGYAIVFANILKPVLLEFCGALCERVRKEGAWLVLSGLVENDVIPVTQAFQKALGRAPTRVLSRNEWRAIVWTP
jgi:ribosomal protein L11 methyltransferase